MPEFESAIRVGRLEVGGAAAGGVSVSDESATAKTLVRSDRPQFAVGFGSCIAVGDALVAGTRPGEWLLLGSSDAVAAAEAAVDRGGFTSVTGFTHGRSLLRVTGERAVQLLETVCGIDWSDPMTPDGAVVSASVALVTCDIIRNDVDGTPSYLLMCDRSYGQYLYDALA